MVLSYFGLNAISQQITLNQSNNSFLQSLNFTYQKDTRTSYLIQAVFIVLWTWVLSYLCRKGFSSLSWFLVLLPWVLMFLAFFVYIIETIKKIFFDTTGSLASALDLP
jgi:small-conductance mechanosensitive channel